MCTEIWRFQRSRMWTETLPSSLRQAVESQPPIDRTLPILMVSQIPEEWHRMYTRWWIPKRTRHPCCRSIGVWIWGTKRSRTSCSSSSSLCRHTHRTRSKVIWIRPTCLRDRTLWRGQLRIRSLLAVGTASEWRWRSVECRSLTEKNLGIHRCWEVHLLWKANNSQAWMMRSTLWRVHHSSIARTYRRRGQRVGSHLPSKWVTVAQRRCISLCSCFTNRVCSQGRV